MAETGQKSPPSNKRRRIIWGSIIGGLLVLAGVAMVADWKGWVPAWCLVPSVLFFAGGIWLLVVTIKQNIRFAGEGNPRRRVFRFGVAVFFILFGIGLPLAAFGILADLVWPVGVLLISVGATFAYRAVVLPNTKEKPEDD